MLHAESVEEKAQLCTSCHGEKGIPQDKVNPVIWGQNEGYLYLQLRDFKSGARKNDIMGPIAATLEKDDMKALAAYFAGLKWPDLGQPRAPKDVSAKAVATNTSVACTGCHLDQWQGYSVTPRLAGQNQAYLDKTMHEFRDRTRAEQSRHVRPDECRAARRAGAASSVSRGPLNSFNEKGRSASVGGEQAAERVGRLQGRAPSCRRCRSGFGRPRAAGAASLASAWPSSAAIMRAVRPRLSFFIEPSAGIEQNRHGLGHVGGAGFLGVWPAAHISAVRSLPRRALTSAPFSRSKRDDTRKAASCRIGQRRLSRRIDRVGISPLLRAGTVTSSRSPP